MEILHTFVANRLFLAKQGRPDIIPGIAYLYTKVKKPNKKIGIN
jgi:hypothetical protein